MPANAATSASRDIGRIGRRCTLLRGCGSGRRRRNLLADAAELDASRLRFRLRRRRRGFARLVELGKKGDDVARRAFRSDSAEDLAEEPVAKRLDLARRLVGLDHEEDVAGLDPASLLDPPLDDSHVAAGRPEMGHDNRVSHRLPLPALPKSCIMASMSRCMARRPGTSTSMASPEPITS